VKFLASILLFISFSASAQLPYEEHQFISRLKTGSPLPENLLSTRTTVFYSPTLSMKELESIQKTFQRTGIDAVNYLESNLFAAGRDVSVSLAGYLNKREITNLAIIEKDQSGYTLYLTEYNKKANLVEQNQPTWSMKHSALDVLLQNVYRTAANSLKRENFLINDVPEFGSSINPIGGRRNEYFSADLKVDQLAVPKFGDEAIDKELEEIMKTYPFKFKLTDANLAESDLRKQGFLYVLRFVHARGKLAMDLLGYDITKLQNSIASVQYASTEPQLINIPENNLVYKFYFKHIESGNVFLGTKWDADETWQQAIINQLKGFKIEFKIP
jgi:hypothetical protein